MSKNQKRNVELPVETVENLIESFEYIISSLNFWKLNDTYPCNLILRRSADIYYLLRKIYTENQKTSTKKKNK